MPAARMQSTTSPTQNGKSSGKGPQRARSPSSGNGPRSPPPSVGASPKRNSSGPNGKSSGKGPQRARSPSSGNGPRSPPPSVGASPTRNRSGSKGSGKGPQAPPNGGPNKTRSPSSGRPRTSSTGSSAVPNRARSGSKNSQSSGGGVSRSRGGSRNSTGSHTSDDGDPVSVNLEFGPDVGYVLLKIDVDYTGSCPVTEQNTEAAEAGLKRIYGMKQPKTPIKLVVSVKGVFLLDRETRSIIKEVSIAELSYVSLGQANPKYFSIIANNNNLNIKTLYSFKCPPADSKEFSLAVNESFMIMAGKLPIPNPNTTRKKLSAAELAEKAQTKGTRKPSFGALTAPIPDPGFVGAFEAVYLCSLAVSEKTGQNTVEDAWSTSTQIGLPQGTGIIMMISSTALKIIDALSQELMFSTVIKEVSFVTSTGPKLSILSYISHSEVSGRTVCHMFARTDAEACKDLIQSIGVAFKKAREENANPFLVKGADATAREKPPQILMKRQIRRGQLTAVKLIGAGQFGQVWLGDLAPVSKKQGESTAPARSVAVKLLKGNARPEDKEDFIRECSMMLRLDHPNLVTFLGAAVQQKPWLCVLEFLNYGDIKAVLEGCSEKAIEVGSSLLLHFSTQVAGGMAHMASLGLVHMDLAARNVLLHNKNLVKVADFGLTNELDDTGIFMLPPGQKLPMKWMAPESMDFRRFSEATDVWAYGITVWEMFAMGAIPYPELTTKQIQAAVREGTRNTQPELMPSPLFDLMLLCWDRNPRLRPSFDDILVELGKFDRADIAGKDLGKELAKAKDKKVIKKSTVATPPWYFGPMPKAAADKICLDSPEGSFLVRLLPQPQRKEQSDKPDPKLPKSWCITVHDSGRLKNFQIQSGTGDNEGKFILGKQPYLSLALCIKQLKTTPFAGKEGPMVLGKACRKPKMRPRKSSVVRKPSGALDDSTAVNVKSDSETEQPTVRRKSGTSIASNKGQESAPVRKSMGRSISDSSLSGRASPMTRQDSQRSTGSNSSKGSAGIAGGSTVWIPSKTSKTPKSTGSFGSGERDSTITIEEVDEDFDPSINKNWLRLKLKKNKAATLLSTAERGEFLVRQNKEKDKFILMVASGGGSSSYSATQKDDGKVEFGEQVHDSVTDWISSLMTKELPCKGTTVVLKKALPKSKKVEAKNDGDDDINSTPASPAVLAANSPKEEHFGFDASPDIPPEDESFGFDQEDTSRATTPGLLSNPREMRNWFMGRMDLETAEQKILECENGDFLVRILPEKDDNIELALMVKDGNKVASFCIDRRDPGYSLLTESGKTLSSVIEKTKRAALKSNVSSNILYMGKPVPGGRKFTKAELALEDDE